MGMKWYGTEQTNYILAGVGKKVKLCAEALLEQIRKDVSRPNPTRRDPSAPGESPKLVTGELKDSIKMIYEEQSRKAVVGSELKKAYWLEMGTSRMDPRPWLSNGIRNCWIRMQAIMKGPRIR